MSELYTIELMMNRKFVPVLRSPTDAARFTLEEAVAFVSRTGRSVRSRFVRVCDGAGTAVVFYQTPRVLEACAIYRNTRDLKKTATAMRVTEGTVRAYLRTCPEWTADVASRREADRALTLTRNARLYELFQECGTLAGVARLRHERDGEWHSRRTVRRAIAAERARTAR